MSEIKEDLFYSDEHEWVKVIEGNLVQVGISDFAQAQLGDIVFVELPELEQEVEAGNSIGSIESVKTVSELYTPVTGKVVKVNEELLNKPELLNDYPYEAGWIVEIEVSGTIEEALSHLLNADAYRKLTE